MIEASESPNILWIVTTQWRASATGYAGDPNARTPCLDALAAQSCCYRQAVTPHPFGPFARAALLTGRRTEVVGVRDYYDPLPTDTATIAHDLHALGYRTAFFGKWHLAARDRNAPLVGEAHARMIVPPQGRGGFDFWEGFESGFLLNDPWLHGTRWPEPVCIPGYQSDGVCARFGEWRKERASSRPPWFALVSLEAPHPPYDAPAAGIQPRDPSDLRLADNVPQGGEAERMARRELAGYYAHIEATDRAIGRLIAGLPEKTIVVFTSVHGDMHGAHGLFRKGWPHEESVRVPLLVRRTTETAGSFSDEAVSLLDLSSMTRAWADGREWRSVRDFAVISMPSAVALPLQCDRPWRGIRTANRKLILNTDGSPWVGFDLERDPGEKHNLVDDPTWAEERSRLVALLGSM